jgi:hypothetical protein
MWMAAHAHLLEDTMYRRLAVLWREFSDAITVFDTNGSDEPLCVQKVWEVRTAYSKIIDELDNVKDLTFDSMHTACVRKVRRGNFQKIRDRADTPSSSRLAALVADQG